MNLYDFVNLVLKLPGLPVLGGVLAGAAAFIFVFTVLNFVWGRMWNRKFGFSLAPTALSFLFALVVGFSSYCYAVSSSLLKTIEEQRQEMVYVLSRSQSLGKQVIQQAWEVLQAADSSGQKDLDPPGSGGVEVRINNDEEARLLTEASATVAGREIGKRGPFALGIPFTRSEPARTASETVLMVENAEYPATVTANNPWTKAAIEHQVESAFRSGTRGLQQPVRDFQRNALLLIIVALAAQMALIPMFALSDIKTD